MNKARPHNPLVILFALLLAGTAIASIVASIMVR